MKYAPCSSPSGELLIVTEIQNSRRHNVCMNNGGYGWWRRSLISADNRLTILERIEQKYSNQSRGVDQSETSHTVTVKPISEGGSHTLIEGLINRHFFQPENHIVLDSSQTDNQRTL